jgi:hypothetical protein
VFSSSFSITLPNIGIHFPGIHFPGIHFPRNSLSKRKQLSCKQTEPKTYSEVERVERVRLQTLREDFEKLNKESNETISYYFTKVISLVHQMRRNGENIDNVRVMEKILRSLDLCGSSN